MKLFGGFVGVILAVVTGCGPAAQVRLIQPQYPGAEGNVRLQSNQVCWAPGEGFDRFLAEFPLPGAVSGRPTYVLYFRVPAPRPGEKASEAEVRPMRGFLIQTQGNNAGLEMLVSGKVQSRGTSMADDAVRKLDIELTFEGNTTMSGRLTARRNDRYVKTFETRRHPSDIQTLDIKTR